MTRIADLAGAELALWVAKAVGLHITCDTWQGAGCTYVLPALEEGGPMFKFTPHTDWAQGGPLIEKHAIVVTDTHSWAPWHACTDHSVYVDNVWVAGDTYLIAAMRALVASVYGEEVQS